MIIESDKNILDFHLESVKAAIASGNYVVDAKAIAEKLLPYVTKTLMD